MALLPDEVWQYVFYHATDNLARRAWKHVDPIEIQPFETFYEHAERDSADKATSVKTSIHSVAHRSKTNYYSKIEPIPSKVHGSTKNDR